MRNHHHGQTRRCRFCQSSTTQCGAGAQAYRLVVGDVVAAAAARARLRGEQLELTIRGWREAIEAARHHRTELLLTAETSWCGAVTYQCSSCGHGWPQRSAWLDVSDHQFRVSQW